MKNIIFSTFIFLAYSSRIQGVQCYVPGECNFSPIIDAIIIDPDSEFDGYSNCLIQSRAYNASWFSFDPNGNVCELFSSCTNLTTEYCQECKSGQLGCEPILCDTPGKCEVIFML